MSQEISEEEMEELISAIGAIAEAITPRGVSPGADETGGHIASLTEATMGITAGLCQVADSIERLAEAVSTFQDYEND